MSNRRSIIWLFLGIVILIAVHLSLIYNGDVETRIVRRLTLVSPNASFNSIELTRKGSPSVRLTRESSWQIVEPFRGGVDEQAVLRLLDVLSFTRIDDVLSESELAKLDRYPSDFSLDQPTLTVTLSGAKDEERISFGGYTPSSNGVYAAISGEHAVFVVPTQVFDAADVKTEQLRSRSLFSVVPSSVLSFDVKRGSGQILAFTREGEQWLIGEEQASPSKVKALLSGILSAMAVNFAWPVGATNEARNATASLLAVYELDPDSAVTVSMKCVDGIDRRLSFGGEADEGHVYALVQNGDAIVTVDSRLREMALQDAVMFTDSRIFPHEMASVTSFTVSDRDLTCVVARGEDGKWRLDAPVVAPADGDVASAILTKILALSAMDVRTEGLRVSVTTNKEPVAVSRLSVLGAQRIEDLRSKEVLKIDPVVIRRIVRIDGGEKPKVSSIVYVRDRRVWAVENPTQKASVDERGVLNILATLNPLTAEKIERLKVLPDELSRYGLDRPFLTLAIDQDRETETRRNILIGGKTDGGRFATVGSADAVFVLSDETIVRLTSNIVSE